MRTLKIGLLSLSLLAFGCNQKMNITVSYLEFKSKPQFLKEFSIVRVIVQDTKIPPQNYFEVKGERYGFITDSNFVSGNRIYFDKPLIGFYWVNLDNGEKVNSIGVLKKSSWYAFNTLHKPGNTLLVYFDESGNGKIYREE